MIRDGLRTEHRHMICVTQRKMAWHKLASSYTTRCHDLHDYPWHVLTPTRWRIPGMPQKPQPWQTTLKVTMCSTSVFSRFTHVSNLGCTCCIEVSNTAQNKQTPAPLVLSKPWYTIFGGQEVLRMQLRKPACSFPMSITEHQKTDIMTSGWHLAYCSKMANSLTDKRRWYSRKMWHVH